MAIYGGLVEMKMGMIVDGDRAYSKRTRMISGLKNTLTVNSTDITILANGIGQSHCRIRQYTSPPECFVTGINFILLLGLIQEMI